MGIHIQDFVTLLNQNHGILASPMLCPKDHATLLNHGVSYMAGKYTSPHPVVLTPPDTTDLLRKSAERWVWNNPHVFDSLKAGRRVKIEDMISLNSKNIIDVLGEMGVQVKLELQLVEVDATNDYAFLRTYGGGGGQRRSYLKHEYFLVPVEG